MFWRVPIIICLLSLGALTSGSKAWSAPIVFCEFASLPPSEALERLAESYRGLLEFGGEQFSPDTASLEKLFEPVAGRDQRSVALNESLTKLGDWVMLEAEELGLTSEEIRARLHRTVQDHLARLHQERVVTEDRRNERREVSHSGQVVTFFDELTFSVTPILIGDGKWAAAGGRRQPVRIQSLEDPSRFHDLEWPELERLLGKENSAIATPISLGDTDRLLVQYLRSDVFEVWNWRTRQRVHRFEVGHETIQAGLLSPSGRFFFAELIGTPKGVILDLETGQAQYLSTGSNLREFHWSSDEMSFSFESCDQHGADWMLRMYRLDASRKDGALANLLFFGARPYNSENRRFPHVYSLQGGNSVVAVNGIDSLSAYHLEPGNAQGVSRLVQSWSPLFGQSQFVRVWNHFLRRDAQGKDELIFIVDKKLGVLDPATGQIKVQPQDLPVGMRDAHHLFFSPSGRYLVAQRDRSREILFWDWAAESGARRVYIAFSFDANRPPVFSADETSFLVKSDRAGPAKAQVWDLEEMGND